MSVEGAGCSALLWLATPFLVFLLEDGEKLLRRHDLDAFIVLDGELVLVLADEVGGGAQRGRGKKDVVVGIAGDGGHVRRVDRRRLGEAVQDRAGVPRGDLAVLAGD